MKTQVIQLDSHDDVVSVRDKMAWAKTGRILLVFPRRARILTRTVDLRLLQRHAATLGAQLAIVARSDELHRTAASLGLPAFPTAAAAQRETWEAPGPQPARRRAQRPDLRQMRREAFPPEPRWRNNGFLRFTFFFLAFLSILALLAIFSPSATLTLTPATQLQSLTLTVSARADLASVSVTGEVPAYTTSAVAERSKTVDVTGSVQVPDQFATGSVRFRNLTTGSVTIPAGTVVSTRGSSPVRFATTEEADLAAGIGKTVDVPVQALVAGSASNLSAETLVAIEGDLGASLAVTNLIATTGGTERPAPIQTAEDRQTLRTDLLAELFGECLSLLPQTLSPDDLYFADTAALAQVSSETYFPDPTQTGETLSLTMTVQCQARYASAADVRTLAALALDANLPAGFTPVSEGLAVLDTSDPVTDAEGVTRWEVQTQRQLLAQIDPAQAAALSISRKPEDAERLLEANLPLDGEPVLTVTPDWWPWMPAIPFRITITTDN